ncbi:Peroxisomal 2,4-dienoyl-CoA reductase, partial [Eschrichtius robustus]|nr:Peroxisomal 2,4-dienoyl-CoA reductase [Eschrichtius robustus]
MRHGCHTVIASRSLPRVSMAARKLAAATGQRCLPLSLDVRAPLAIMAAVEQALKEFGKIDILINCGPQASMRAKVLASPLQRLGNKTEIAHSALFLASPLASYVTGALLVVDGGAWLTFPNDIQSLADFSSFSAKL